MDGYFYNSKSFNFKLDQIFIIQMDSRFIESFEAFTVVMFQVEVFWCVTQPRTLRLESSMP